MFSVLPVKHDSAFRGVSTEPLRVGRVSPLSLSRNGPQPAPLLFTTQPCIHFSAVANGKQCMHGCRSASCSTSLDECLARELGPGCGDPVLGRFLFHASSPVST